MARVFVSARSPDDALRAVLWTVAPALLAPVLVPDAAAALGVPPPAGGGLAALLVIAGAARFPARWAQALATVGLALALVGWCTSHPDDPQGGFVLLLGAIGLGAGLWPADGRSSVWRSFAPVPAAAGVALALALFGWTSTPDGPGGDLALAASAIVPATIAAQRATGRLERQFAAVAALLPVSYSALRLGGLLDAEAVVAVALGPLLLLSRTVPPEAVWRPAWQLFLEVVVSSPPRLLVLSFGALSLLGAFLLALPVSDAQGRGLGLVDALFMAVSATCVTGLATVDVGSRLTTFGQVLLVVLMQLGGLGIMTFASAAVVLGGRRLGLRQERVAVQLLGRDAQIDLKGALRRVLVVTAVFEGAGVLLLFPSLVGGATGWLTALGEAVFTSVSAFCNGGLLPWDEGLARFRQAPWVLLVTAALVVAGSLGPGVILALPDLVRGRKVPMYVRLTVLATVALLVLPGLLFLSLEWSNTLRGLAWHDRVANAWLMTVAPRTAGFDSVGVAAVDPGTWTVLVLLMFVGGGVGSTAGGIRVTTFAVLILAGIATIRGRRNPEFGYRQIPHRAVYEALTVTCAGITTVFAGLLLLQLTQKLPLRVALFEVVSAANTVGLSMGGTQQVDVVGKIVLVACMFAGRVGPLTLILFVSEREREPAPTAWPVEEVPIV